MHKDAEILIGCDPEIFVQDTSINQIISAHGLINGDKLNPEWTEFGAHQVDGMALEFNIIPARTLTEFLLHIDRTMKSLETKIKEKNPTLEFKITPVADFTPEYLETVPDEAKVLGCTPDFNAYTAKMNKTPNSERPMRTAAGHIHIGWTEEQDPFEAQHFYDCTQVTRQLDACLFNLSYLWDKDQRRRTMYGAKGAFRPKHYGVEYRVLSNEWLKSKQLQGWIYQSTVRAMELLAEGICLDEQEAFSIKGPSWTHRTLVRDYGFPSLPGYSGE